MTPHISYSHLSSKTRKTERSSERALSSKREYKTLNIHKTRDVAQMKEARRAERKVKKLLKKLVL